MSKFIWGAFMGYAIMCTIDFVAIKTQHDKAKTKVACQKIIEEFNVHPIGMMLLAGGWGAACVDVIATGSDPDSK